jgi:hypothetical protein
MNSILECSAAFLNVSLELESMNDACQSQPSQDTGGGGTKERPRGYWMSRDQRAGDNWAFHLCPGARPARWFSIGRGLLPSAGVPRNHEPALRFVSEQAAGCLVSDFSPLRQSREWQSTLAEKILSELPSALRLYNISINCYFCHDCLSLSLPN